MLLAALWAVATLAHHSLTSVYDSSRNVTLSATVREFLFIHPHPFLIVEVRTPSGESQAWRAEMDNRFELEQIGMTGSTFRQGDRVIISGSPGRSQPTMLYLLQLDRPADRLRYRQIGGTPSLDTLPP